MSAVKIARQSIYTKQGLWSLFLMCAFPLHLWTLILAFQDVEWIIKRTNAWDAIGTISYALIFALAESILLFLTLTLVGFIIPRHWKPNKRIGFLILLVFILATWAVISQLLFLWHINLPESTIQFLAQSGHPLRYLYAGILTVVLPSIILPVYFFLKSEKMLAQIEAFANQLSTLTGFYLFFDVMGMIIVIIRNV